MPNDIYERRGTPKKKRNQGKYDLHWSNQEMIQFILFPLYRFLWKAIVFEDDHQSQKNIIHLINTWYTYKSFNCFNLFYSLFRGSGIAIVFEEDRWSCRQSTLWPFSRCFNQGLLHLMLTPMTWHAWGDLNWVLIDRWLEVRWPAAMGVDGMEWRWRIL